MAKKLPETVYVYSLASANEPDLSDLEEWLEVAETAEACAEINEKRVVGVYELKEMLNVSLEVKEELIVKKTDS